MGFRPEPTIYNLDFKGTPLDGLHVKMSCCTLAEYNEMLKAAVYTPEPDKDGNVRLDSEMMDRNDRVLELLANHLISWDLEDMIGGAVPATRAGLDSQERNIASYLVAAWQMAMVTIPNLSKPESSDGSTSEEQELGLGKLSESPPS